MKLEEIEAWQFCKLQINSNPGRTQDQMQSVFQLKYNLQIFT